MYDYNGINSGYIFFSHLVSYNTISSYFNFFSKAEIDKKLAFEIIAYQT